MPCIVEGVAYRDKEQWQPDPCTVCQCNDQTVDCTDLTCPELSCPNPVYQDGVCCPSCESSCPTLCPIVNWLWLDTPVTVWLTLSSLFP